MSDTQVTIVGNLTDDPQLKYVGEDAVANFSVAVNDSRKDSDGNWQSVLNGFYRVAAWKKLGEGLAEVLVKGDRVLIVGTIRQREYEDNKGNKRLSVEVTAQDGGKSLKFGVRQ